MMRVVRTTLAFSVHKLRTPGSCHYLRSLSLISRVTAHSSRRHSTVVKAVVLAGSDKHWDYVAWGELQPVSQMEVLFADQTFKF